MRLLELTLKLVGLNKLLSFQMILYVWAFKATNKKLA